MAGEIEAKLKAERMFAEAQAKALGGPYANISKEYVNKYMDSSSLSKALAERVSTNYSLGYLSGWAGIPGDMLNALTSWAVSGIPDQRLRQQAKRSLTVAGTEEIGEAMGADVESEAFQWGTVGLPGLEDLVKKSPYLSMVLFHGTPHKFDKFDISKIGTGEGAQAFGHGLYFAENPGVARSYQANLTPDAEVLIGGKPVTEVDVYQLAADAGIDTVEGTFRAGRARDAVKRVGRHGDIDAAIQEIDALAPSLEGKFPREAQNLRDEKEFLEGIRGKIEVGPKERGHLYEVDIPDEVVDQMLDWDAPLSEQPEVKSAMESALGRSLPGDLTGERAYRALAGQIGDSQFVKGVPGSQEAASSLLSQSGIPGIRFYDGGSRAKGEGTRNIVVFDPETSIKKVKRDGELVYEAGTN